MAIGEADLASPSDDDGAALPTSEFDTVRRGFAPDQVAEYLKRVAASVFSLESRLEETRSELLEARMERDLARAELQAPSNQDPYEDVSDRVIGLVRNFDHQVGQLLHDAEVESERVQSEVRIEADRILGEARQEAERLTAEARTQAERIVAEAQTEEDESRMRAGRLILDARREADRAESDVTALRESMLDTFRDIRQRTITALGEVEAAIENGATPDRVVLVDDATDAAAGEAPPVPRPDL